MGDGGPPTCPLCGTAAVEHFAYARDLEYRTDDLRYEYLHCERCHVVFLLDPPVERLAEIYPPNYYSYTATETRSIGERLKEALDRRWFRRVLDDVPGDQLRVLDVGGGSGWLLTQARAASPRVTETHEVDLAGSAREAAEAAGHTFHATRVEDFVTDTRFDLIIMLNLIEHVPDPSGVLDALLPLLTPSGRVIIKTPNYDTLDCRWFKSRYWGGFHCPRHFVLFRRDSLARLAESRGFDVLGIEYTQGAPQWTASVLGLLQRRGYIAITSDRPMHTHPLYGPLNLLFATVDFARRPFSATAQMTCVLGPRPIGEGGGPADRQAHAESDGLISPLLSSPS